MARREAAPPGAVREAPPGPPSPGRGRESALLGTEALFRAHAQRVARLIIRLGAAPMDVEDLLQDVFLVVARSKDFDSEGSAKPMTWLTAITMRVMANYRRARRRLASRETPLGAEPLADQAPAPELVYADQRRRLLMRALDTLPAQQRDLIVLFELEGHSCVEIAACLDTKPSAVHSRLSRARKTLKKRLEALQREVPSAAPSLVEESG